MRWVRVRTRWVRIWTRRVRVWTRRVSVWTRRVRVWLRWVRVWTRRVRVWFRWARVRKVRLWFIFWFIVLIDEWSTCHSRTGEQKCEHVNTTDRTDYTFERSLLTILCRRYITKTLFLLSHARVHACMRACVCGCLMLCFA